MVRLERRRCPHLRAGTDGLDARRPRWRRTANRALDNLRTSLKATRDRTWHLLRIGRVDRAGDPMSYFVVTREAGPAWIDGKGAFDQPGAADHAAFMNTLHEEGLVTVAGPLAGSERDRIRVLLIADAESEAEIHDRLADDPWVAADYLVTTSIEPWIPIVGAERLATASLRKARPGVA